MPDADLIRRIEIVEQKVEGLVLPGRMTRSSRKFCNSGTTCALEFSAIQHEITAAVDGVRTKYEPATRKSGVEDARCTRM